MPGPEHLSVSESLLEFLLRQSAPVVMGIVNVTPDSFADGGRYEQVDSAVAHAHELIAEGAGIIDVGGESTRPGAPAVPVQQELDRVIPVIERLAADTDRLISVDTSKAQVMSEAVSAGAGMINDVSALEGGDALATAAQLDVPVCLMHMQGTPRSMQEAPAYGDVTGEVSAYLASRAQACLAAGITADRILLDPGFGFGKTLAHNLRLFRDLPVLAGLGYPLLIGVSRKSMPGALTGREVGDRLAGSLGLALLAAQKGAAIIRVHDVAPTVDILSVLSQIDGATNVNGEH